MINSKVQMPDKTRLGMVVSGSLSCGLEVKMDEGVSVEDMAVGKYVIVKGSKKRFFGMITDVTLGSINSNAQANLPDISDPFIAEVVRGTSAFGILHVLPKVVLGIDEESLLLGPRPVKSIPSHFSTVEEAAERDIELVFGGEDSTRFHIGNPLDMEMKICLNLEEYVKRSNGIFGKSGTGKTFLCRLLLIGILQKSQAVNLVFDMHNEYGWDGTGEANRRVKSLKQLFPSRVAVFTLDEESSRRRQVTPDFVVRIGYDEIEPEDIELLRDTLRMSELMLQAVHRLARHFGDKSWLVRFLNLKGGDEVSELAEEMHENESSLKALWRRLQVLKRFPFLVPGSPENSVARILHYLQQGKHVVLQFGRYTDITAYILVANLLTRRIYDIYREQVEEAMAEGKQGPPHLVICIEEAHKFLNPEVSEQTIFGIIAREMRKYHVTLLVVDQRPSGIDDDVMSQLGTKMTCLLDNEKDIDSVLAGTPDRNELKSVLAKLESKQQVLIFGHAVPMPLVVQVREYGSVKSYEDLQKAREVAAARNPEKLEDFWGKD